VLSETRQNLTRPSKVIGIDIAATQPEWSPPNCRFEIANVEGHWPWKHDSVDFIFARDLITAVRDWPTLIDKIYTCLRPFPPPVQSPVSKD